MIRHTLLQLTGTSSSRAAIPKQTERAYQFQYTPCLCQRILYCCIFYRFKRKQNKKQYYFCSVNCRWYRGQQCYYKQQYCMLLLIHILYPIYRMQHIEFSAITASVFHHGMMAMIVNSPPQKILCRGQVGGGREFLESYTGCILGHRYSPVMTVTSSWKTRCSGCLWSRWYYHLVDWQWLVDRLPTIENLIHGSTN